MEFSVPGFIKRYCQPNAILTMVEYLEDYANEDLKTKGYKMISNKVDEYKDKEFKTKLVERIEKIKLGKRDLYF
jgi:2-iminoacetate synthase